MTTFAAGLAKKGFLPITYTIATFNTLKTIEQIKSMADVIDIARVKTK